MMIAMTYNGYLMIAICVGGLVGYLLYGSVMFNICAQVVVQRIMCLGCEIKPGLYCQLIPSFLFCFNFTTAISPTDGDLVPIIEEENEQAGTSETHSNSESHDQQVFTTAQVHNHS